MGPSRSSSTRPRHREWALRALGLALLSLAPLACQPRGGALLPAVVRCAGETGEASWQAAPGLSLFDARGCPRVRYRVAVRGALEGFEDPALRLSNGNTLLAVWVDGRPTPREGTGLLVPLRRGSERVELELLGGRRVHAPRFVVGSQRALWASALRTELPTFAASASMLLAGALLLLSTLRRGSARAYRGLGLFLASLGLLTLLNLRLLSSLLGLSFRQLFHTHEVVTSLYPVGFAEFVLATLGDGPRALVRRGLRVFLAYTAGAWALHLAGVVHLSQSRALVVPFILLFVGQALSVALSKARQGDGVSRAFLVGIAGMVLLSTPDLGDAANLWVSEYELVPFGLLFFAASAVLMVERQFTQFRGETQRASAALEARLRDLEKSNEEVRALNAELRHQVAERSRGLVGLARTSLPGDPGAAPVELGAVVGGRYRLVRVLGAGGMGKVFEAERLSDKKRFALKLLTGTHDATSAARFAREAEIAARLMHDNLVAVVDVGAQGVGQLYLVMELVEGRSLAELRHRFGDVAWALRILPQMARGLAALHAAGVVHRDLKPANVLLEARGAEVERVRIADFGISSLDSSLRGEDDEEPPTQRGKGPLRPPAEEGQDDFEQREHTQLGEKNAFDEGPAPPTGELTGYGEVLGTPPYMAPELVRGVRTARPAADLFAYGLIAYEMLSGRKAFTELPLRYALTGRSLPTPAPLPPEVPRRVVSLVFDALSPSPGLRPTAEEFLEAFASEGL